MDVLKKKQSNPNTYPILIARHSKTLLPFRYFITLIWLVCFYKIHHFQSCICCYKLIYNYGEENVNNTNLLIIKFVKNNNIREFMVYFFFLNVGCNEYNNLYLKLICNPKSILSSNTTLNTLKAQF